MSPNRTRRAVLAALGGISVAGCVSDDARDGTDPADSTDESKLSGATPATGSPTESPGATAAPLGSPTSTDRTPPTPDEVSTDWAIPGVDQGRTNYLAGASGPTAPVGELWSLDVGVPLSAPVVADGTVYVGGNDGVVRAIDARTGAQTWQRSVGASSGERPARPRVRDGRVYVEGTDELVALNAVDGSVSWRTSTGRVHALLVADHGVYCTERADDSFVRRTGADGSERWRVTVDGGGPSSPVLASDEYVFFRHPRTSGPWSLSVSDGQRDFEDAEYTPTPLPYHSPSPQAYRDGTLYNAETFSGTIEAMTPPAPPFDAIWNRRWQPTDGGFLLAVDDEAVYLATGTDSGPVLRSLSRSDGTERWRHSIGAPQSPPVVTEETLLVDTAEELRCLDPSDGTPLWRSQAAGVGEGRLVVVDDMIITTADRTLRAFRSVPE